MSDGAASETAVRLRASLARVREGLPYPGFRPFRRDEWPIFFGRERQVQALLGLLAAHRFICIHGPSGGGKSSLIEAGLIATLARVHARLDTKWCTSTFRPGTTPIWNLARGLLRALHPEDEPATEAVVEVSSRLNRPGGSIALAIRESGLAEGTSLLLIADQFEELFRLRALSDQREMRRFVDLLLGVYDEQPKGIHVVVATRTDFLGDCSDVIGLAEAVNAAPYLTPALTEDELRAAIRGPAELHGGKVDDALVEQMLADSTDAPDRLPILQHTLMRCWDVAQRRGTPGRLTLDLYQSPDIVNVREALNCHAEEVMASPELDGLGREVEAAFKALTELDGQGRAIRRPLPWAQLCAETAGEPARLERVVNRFRAEGTGFLGRPGPEEKEFKPDTVVDVAHEALIRRWRRISRPAEAGTGRQREGWLWDQTVDANIYRALLLDAGSASETIGAQVLDERIEWWERQPRTAAWARRMAGDRDATEQDAIAGLAQIEELFKRSKEERQRQEMERLQLKQDRERQVKTRRLLGGATILIVVAVVLGGFYVLRLRAENANARAEAALTQAVAASKLAAKDKLEAERQSSDLQRLIVVSAERQRLSDQLNEVQSTLAALRATTGAGSGGGGPAATASADRTEVAAAARPLRPVATPGPAAAAQSCGGAIWIGSGNALNLAFDGADAGRPVTLGDIKADRRFTSTKNVRLRQGLPKEGYVQQVVIGIVPQGAQIVALGAPAPYTQPAGTQYWLDVSVSGQICSLVYFQYFAGPTGGARSLKDALEKQGYLVPGQEQLSSAQGVAEVRYYHVEDKGSADQLAKDAMADAKTLGLAAGRQITVADFTGWPEQKKPTRGTLELWLDLSKS